MSLAVLLQVVKHGILQHQTQLWNSFLLLRCEVEVWLHVNFVLKSEVGLLVVKHVEVQKLVILHLFLRGSESRLQGRVGLGNLDQNCEG